MGSYILHQPNLSRPGTGACPSTFFEAKRVALEKKGDGVRTIAVGCTLCRLATKAAAVHVKGPMRSLLAPRQLGYGTPQGAEAAVHANRMYLDNLPPLVGLLQCL